MKSGQCYYRNYQTCQRSCDGNGRCRACECPFTDNLQQPCGTCREISSCSSSYSCSNSISGTACTSSGVTGTCDGTGNCIINPISIPNVDLSVSTISIGGQATLSGKVTCSNGYCGTVHVLPKGSKGTSLPMPLDNVSGLEVACTPGHTNCYFDCGSMAAGQTCSPSWQIKGKSAGAYSISLLATGNDNVLPASSSAVILNVVPNGQLSASLYSQPPFATTGNTADVTFAVSCSGENSALCGIIDSYLTAPSYVSVSAPNPKAASCTGLAAGGQPCYVKWTVSSIAAGTYPLSFTADPDNPNVANASASATFTVTNNPVVKITSASLSKSTIITGETARLSAAIVCSSSGASCGTVKAYLSGTPGTLTIPNPERNCGTMSPASGPCSVSWDITGNAIGSYTLSLRAYSVDSPLVQNTSNTTSLEVSNNLGKLSIPNAELNPGTIDMKTSATNSTKLTAWINCSTSYCGKVSAYLSTKLAVLNQNTKSCPSAYPCILTWELKGSSEGTFPITIKATSNESIQANATTTAYVEGYSPQLSTEILKPDEAGNYITGQPVEVRAKISCRTKYCGRTKVSLGYNPGSWKPVPYGNINLTSDNGNTIDFGEMSEGQSGEASWTVEFAGPGAYEIGVFANGSSAGIINASQSETINVRDYVGNITILSPNPDEKFSRGDSVFLKASITMEGNPVLGLSPTVPKLEAKLYDDGNHNDGQPDDGVYAGSGTVPSQFSGRYELQFMAGEDKASIYINVDPTLQVTVNTDRDQYSGGDMIRITGEVRKRDAPAEANVTLLLTLSSGSVQNSDYWSTGITINATGSYSSDVSAPNKNGNIRINVTAQDSFKNRGYNYKEVLLAARTGDLYNVSFILGKYNYIRGENITIAVKVTDSDIPQSGVNVTCEFRGGTIELGEGGAAGIYYGIHLVQPSAALGNESLSCKATGIKSGTGFVNIKIEPITMNISVINPEPYQNILPVVSNQPVELKVAVFYPDNTPVTDAIVQVGLGSEIKNLTYSGIPGIYTTDVRFRKSATGAAITSMFLTAEDQQGNYGQANVTLAVDTGEFSWWWLLLIPAGLATFFAAWWIYTRSREPPKIQIQEKIIRVPTVERVREVVYRQENAPARRSPEARLRDEIERLEARQMTTQSAKELAEQQYYKRQIDEKTFNKLMQDYEEKLIEIDASIRQKKKDLKSA
jgi:hypothetical protein